MFVEFSLASSTFIKALVTDLVEVCNNLYFDKSRSFAGYPMIISEIEFGYDPAVKDEYKFFGFTGRLLKEVLSPLQPTINIALVDSASFAIGEDGDQIGSSILKILNGTFDMRSYWQNQRTFGVFWKNE